MFGEATLDDLDDDPDLEEHKSKCTPSATEADFAKMCNSAHLRAHTGGVLCRRLRAVAPPNVRVARIRFPSDDVPVVHRGYGSGERKHQTALA